MLTACKTPALLKAKELIEAPAHEEMHAEQGTPLHYTHYCQRQPSKAG